MKETCIRDMRKGQIFSLYNKLFCILDKRPSGILCIDCNPTQRMRFSYTDNDYFVSHVRNYLLKDYISQCVDSQSISPCELISFVPGTQEYAMLLSESEYRKYESIIPEIDETFWLRSPCITLLGIRNNYVSSVSGLNGKIVRMKYNSELLVRPVIKLNPNTVIPGKAYDER